MKLIILVFVFGVVISCNGQIKFELIDAFSTTTKDFTTDHLNRIYLIDNNQIFKLNYAGDTLYVYSNKTLGNINCLDVNNTLRPILFFKENARIVVTDNTLSAQQNPYSLEDLDLRSGTVSINKGKQGIRANLRIWKLRANSPKR